MPYLEINFDPFIKLATITNAAISNPLNLLSLVETVGANGISFTYSSEIGQMGNLTLLRSLSNCRINIRVSADMQILQKALLLRPDLITICDPERDDCTVEIPSKVIKELTNAVLTVNEIGVSLRLKPDVKQLKEAYQMGIDEVELATDELARQDKKIAFLDCLETLVHAVNIGSRNNLRISIGGQLNRRIVRAVNEVVQVEFISLGRALLAQAFLQGFEAAVREMMEVVDIS
jgi:pyridoxine 5'-phosphate synthase PdxJ